MTDRMGKSAQQSLCICRTGHNPGMDSFSVRVILEQLTEIDDELKGIVADFEVVGIAAFQFVGALQIPWEKLQWNGFLFLIRQMKRLSVSVQK